MGTIYFCWNFWKPLDVSFLYKMPETSDFCSLGKIDFRCASWRLTTLHDLQIVPGDAEPSETKNKYLNFTKLHQRYSHKLTYQYPLPIYLCNLIPCFSLYKTRKFWFQIHFFDNVNDEKWYHLPIPCLRFHSDYQNPLDISRIKWSECLIVYTN